MDKDSMRVIVDFLQKYKKEDLRITFSILHIMPNAIRIRMTWGRDNVVDRLINVHDDCDYLCGVLSTKLEEMHDEFYRMRELPVRMEETE